MIMAHGAGGSAAFTLSKAPEKLAYIIDKVSGPDQHRLSELGLVGGAKISVLSRCRDDMLVVKIGGCRMALARGMAEHVWVR